MDGSRGVCRPGSRPVLPRTAQERQGGQADLPVLSGTGRVLGVLPGWPRELRGVGWDDPAREEADAQTARQDNQSKTSRMERG